MNAASPAAPRFESSYTASTNKITIKFNDAVKGTNAFQIHTDAELKQIAPTLVSTTMNNVLNNFNSKEYSKEDHVTGYVDLYPLRNIYMTSSGLGNFNTISL